VLDDRPLAESTARPGPLVKRALSLYNMTQYKEEHNGAVPFFGKLTGFKLVRLVDYFQFDAAGRFVE
jgi:hypothetical protein